MKHKHGGEDAAPKSDAARHVSAVFELFFFFFFSRICTDLALIRAKLGKFNQNQAVSAGN